MELNHNDRWQFDLCEHTDLLCLEASKGRYQAWLPNAVITKANVKPVRLVDVDVHRWYRYLEGGKAT